MTPLLVMEVRVNSKAARREPAPSISISAFIGVRRPPRLAFGREAAKHVGERMDRARVTYCYINRPPLRPILASAERDADVSVAHSAPPAACPCVEAPRRPQHLRDRRGGPRSSANPHREELAPHLPFHAPPARQADRPQQAAFDPATNCAGLNLRFGRDVARSQKFALVARGLHAGMKARDRPLDERPRCPRMLANAHSVVGGHSSYMNR